MQLLPLLVCCIPVLDALSTVTQFPPSVEVTVGASVTLECRFDLFVPYCYTVNWMKLQFTTNMLTTYKNNNMNASSFSLISNISSRKCTLSISSATESDSGIYYCSVAHGSMIYLGNGSTVMVMGKTSKNLSIEVLTPPDSSDSKVPLLVPLLCLVSGSGGSRIHLSWLIGGRAENGSTDYRWTSSLSEILWTQNLVLVPAEEWKSGTLCTCVVEFAGQRFLKSLQHQGSATLCLTLFYVASGAAALVVIVAMSVLACLYRGWPLPFRVRRTGIEHRYQSSDNTLLYGAAGQRNAGNGNVRHNGNSLCNFRCGQLG